MHPLQQTTANSKMNSSIKTIALIQKIYLKTQLGNFLFYFGKKLNFYFLLIEEALFCAFIAEVALNATRSC